MERKTGMLLYMNRILFQSTIGMVLEVCNYGREEKKPNET